MIKDALYYGCVLGVPVFPTARDCRKPLTEHGYKDASSDPDVIKRLWAGRTRANIAAATGAASGAFVVDVDVKGAGNGFETLDDLERANRSTLPVTWTARTPSGGAHMWFSLPGDRRLRNRVAFKPGLDVRTDGGSVALPPSRRPDGTYRWQIAPLSVPLAEAPPWLLRLIDPPRVPRPPPPPIRGGSLDRLAHYAASAIDGECSAVATMGPNSGRNQRLFQAAARLGELVGAGLLNEDLVAAHLESAADACGLVREDGWRAVHATIKSGLERGKCNPREVIA